MWSKSGPTEEGGSGVGIAVLRGILRARCTPLLARVVKLVDTGDLKSPGHCGRAGSSPAPGTNNYKGFRRFGCFGKSLTVATTVAT